VVVAALNVHDLVKAALPLGNVVRHVRHEVRVGAVALAHHAVLVVAVIGRPEPQCPVLFVGFSGLDQLVDRGLDAAAGVQAGLQVVVVEPDLECLQVQILFVAQIRHGELANRIEIVDVATGGVLAVVGADGLLCLEVFSDVGDVLAVVEGLAERVVGVGRPAGIARLEPLGPQLRAVGQRGDLHAGVVVIELAPDVVALAGEQVADGIAQCGLAAMADMQRAGRVGRHEFDQHAHPRGRLLPVMRAGFQHLAHDLLLGLRREADVEETGTGDVDAFDPALVGRRGEQGQAQFLTELTRIFLERLGQLHGRGAGEIAVRSDLGRFEGGLGAGAGLDRIEHIGQHGEQVLLD